MLLRGAVEIFRAFDQCRDGDGKREHIEACIFLPAVLARGRAGTGDEAYGARNHVLHRDSIQRLAPGQERCEQNGKRRLVELQAWPEGTAAEPLVLEPMTVLVLGGDEVAQHVARVAVGFHGDERAGRLGRADAAVEELPEGGDEGGGEQGGAEAAVPASQPDAGTRKDKGKASSQGELAGTEPISDAELAQRKADERLKAKADQKPADAGLFSDDKDQTDHVEEERKAAGTYGASNTLFTAERHEEVRKRLKAKLSGQLNEGIDPEILALGAEMAGFHIESGARKFVDMAKAVAKDLDMELAQLRPYLRSWYNGARDMMEDQGLDVAGMDGPDQVRIALAGLVGDPKRKRLFPSYTTQQLK